ncbi:hypothetical protein [Mycolicibacterium vinylchloridicum]|uniref:hypothetical protein n=1 Tax=Mycolicibacterium vinylchloridicum TaxID=2736928 RepID=UPI0015C6B69C|nr:hypothetical protein [Mycolicibacterium vinylchloridicum]
MARDGSDDPNNYSDSEPTQYANYGATGGEAYSDYQQPAYGAPTGYGHHPPPPEPAPWYRKPAALVGLGVLTAVILALLVYAIVKFTGSGGSGPATTTTTAPTSPSSAEQSASVVPQPGVTQTVTQSPTATSEAPTTTTTTEAPTTTTTTAAPSTSTSTSTSTTTTVSTSVSTVTETVTPTTREQFMPTFPLPRPGG